MSGSSARQPAGVSREQRAVVEFLASGDWLADDAGDGTPAGKVERHDTHGAHVFLGGDLAIKIKRDVHYSYMDFSTLDRRRAALERELEVNRANAPEIYLDVRPIMRAGDGGLRLGGKKLDEKELGGEEQAVEWCLRMRRFPQAALLARLIERGLDDTILKAVADEVWRSHRIARVVHPVSAAAPLAAIIDEVWRALGDRSGDDTSARTFRDRAVAVLESAGPVLERRAAAGLVRRCHGDLHLENIVVLDGRPRLFDAIEFDEAIATVDTLYDLAFVLMDIEARGNRGQANVLLNRYLWKSGESLAPAGLDFAGLAAMPLFLGLRAGVRAMVSGQRAELASGDARSGGHDDARPYASQPAGHYGDLALRYLEPARGVLVGVGGLSGTGKSTLAAALAPRLGPAPGAVHLRSDLERKALHGVDELTRLPDEAYAAGESDRVYEVLYDKAGMGLRAGHAVVVDAVFASPAERRALEAVARDCGVRFAGVWLEAGREQLMERVAARVGDASDATPEVVARQLARGIGHMDWSVVDAGAAVGEVAARALEVIRGVEGRSLD